jgi:SAM-dependent methyltransferase
MSNTEQVKSKKRVADHGEVFTSDREVNAMLDLVKQETERIDSRFLEPACGDGNFLAEILRRKLKIVKDRYKRSPSDYEKYAVLAVTSIYGVDILPDNAQECRKRLFEVFDKEYKANCKKEINDECREAVRFILRRNILCGDALTLKTTDGEPIIFSEWSLVTGALIKRTDYRMDFLLAPKNEVLPDVPPGTLPPNTKQKQKQLSFNDSDNTEKDDATGRINEYPLIHYRRVQEYE